MDVEETVHTGVLRLAATLTQSRSCSCILSDNEADWGTMLFAGTCVSGCSERQLSTFRGASDSLSDFLTHIDL